MKLELFDFIEQTMSYYEQRLATCAYAEGKIIHFFEQLFQHAQEPVVSIHSRIKSASSLKEKLIRNQFYRKYEAGADALDHLSDLIGITVQCRFIRNEAALCQLLSSHFHALGDERCFQADEQGDIYLDLSMPQPQLQRNGFTIYRIDGYYLFNREKIRFELQIKSLVHAFWSEIEHEVVYKNPNFAIYDQFNKNMLAAIRDNLDVVDRQLEIMYNEISSDARQAQIGMDENGFKHFVARSINELVNRKMIESVGFTTDFKKCSAMIAQYVYLRDFVNGDHNKERMMDYLELLNLLGSAEMDLSQEIHLEEEYHSSDPFCEILGKYWMREINSNFQWHIFFAMLFSIQPGNNREDFADFCNIIRILFVQPGWYAASFCHFSAENAKKAQDHFIKTLADTLVEADCIEIVHEDKVYQCMTTFRQFIDELTEKYSDYTGFESAVEQEAEVLRSRLLVHFQSV